MNDKRTQRIARLDAQRAKGSQAEAQLKSLEGVFEDVRRQLYIELVAKAKAEGKVPEGVVWQMVGLDNLVRTLDNKVSAGRVAARKLDEMRHEVGDDDD